MSPTISAGLLVIGFGLFGLVLERISLGILVRSYAARHSANDVERYEKRQKLYFRALSGLFLLCGLAMLVYGLMGGNLPRA
jgi:hypothetical protein